MSALYDLIGVIGAIVLFSSWVMQQTLLDKTKSETRRIERAEERFATYQSNEALFNAILVATQGVVAAAQDQEGSAETGMLRQFETHNYLTGLRDLEQITGIQPLNNMFPSVAETRDQTIKVLTAAAERKSTLKARQDRYNRWFVIAYGAGSLLLIVSSLLKLKP